MANSIAWSVVAACLIFLTMFFAIGDSPIVEREPVVVDPVIDTFSSSFVPKSLPASLVTTPFVPTTLSSASFSSGLVTYADNSGVVVLG